MRVMTRQAIRGLTSIPPLWPLVANGAVASKHTQLIALRRVNDACCRQCSW